MVMHEAVFASIANTTPPSLLPRPLAAVPTGCRSSAPTWCASITVGLQLREAASLYPVNTYEHVRA